MQTFSFNYHQYKKKINKQNVSIIPLLLCIIIISLGIAFFLRPKKTEINKFYFVEIDNFETYKDASNLAQKIQVSGGAGYVYYNNSYHVLASFFPYYDQAESVCKNLIDDYNHCQVFSINCKKFKSSSNLTSNQNNVIDDFSSIIYRNIYKLAELSIKYDKNEIDISKLQLEYKSIYNEINPHYETFISTFKTNAKFNNEKDYASGILSSFEQLTKIETEQEINRKIKYETIKIVINYSCFLSCF